MTVMQSSELIFNLFWCMQRHLLDKSYIINVFTIYLSMDFFLNALSQTLHPIRDTPFLYKSYIFSYFASIPDLTIYLFIFSTLTFFSQAYTFWTFILIYYLLLKLYLQFTFIHYTIISSFIFTSHLCTALLKILL